MLEVLSRAIKQQQNNQYTKPINKKSWNKPNQRIKQISKVKTKTWNKAVKEDTRDEEPSRAQLISILEMLFTT